MFDQMKSHLQGELQKIREAVGIAGGMPAAAAEAAEGD